MEIVNVSEEDPCYAICSFCNKLIKKGNANSYSTSSLLKHLNSKHQREISETRNTSSTSSSNKSFSDSSSTTPKQRKLTATNQASVESYSPVKQWKINDQKAIKLIKKIMNMIAMDNQPFLITSDQGS